MSVEGDGERSRAAVLGAPPIARAKDSSLSGRRGGAGWRAALASLLILPLGASAAQITIAWNDNSANETGFKIERALSDLTYSQVATVAANVATYMDTTVSPATTYWYRVRATNASGDSGYSNIITATAAAASTPPVISNIPDRTISPNTSTGALAFTVSDAETPADSLTLTRSSSNTGLVPVSAIVFSGSGSNRAVTVTPAGGQSGSATITVTVSDGALSSSNSFAVTVTAANTPPTITSIPNQTVAPGASTGAIGFTVGDAQTAASSLTLSGASSNTTLVPIANIVFGGSGANRTVNVTPAGTQTGAATVTVTVSDGTSVSSTAFTLTVNPTTNPAPTGLRATAGDARVDLAWTPVATAFNYRVKRSTVNGGPYTSVASEVTNANFSDTGLINGTTYYYVVTAVGSAGESSNSAAASATPVAAWRGQEIPYVTGTSLGTLSNNYSGWIGMQLQVGANALTVSRLGRMMAPGNTGTHTVKLVKASDGADVAGATVDIAMNGGTSRQFIYGALGAPVTLAANTTYYLLSQETSGGDSWYDWDTVLNTSDVAADGAVVWGSGGPGSWRTLSARNQSFVPVDFMYSSAASSGGGAYVTGFTPGTLQNNYTGWLGMQLVVGSAPMTVSELGRMMAPGNTGTHAVKLVKASDGTDVAGGAVAIAMSGGTVGQFRTAALGSPVTLAANTAYYLMSQETAGGDYWYDWDTVVTTASVAADNAVVWGSGGPGTWRTLAAGNQSFVPLNLTYSGTGAGGSGTYVTGVTPGTVQNNYSGWIGMQFVVGAAPMTVSELGRMMAPGNGGTHTVKLVNAADGNDVAGGAASLTMSGGTVGQFRYASLAKPVTLAANATYYIVSQETSGGDNWYDWDTVLTTANVAADTAVVWGAGGPGTWRTLSAANQSFVPLNFKYTTTSSPSGTEYVTAVTAGTPQNNYTGWLGLQMVVGSTPVTISQLGRMMVPGNTGTHTVKLVNAADGTDVPGSAVSVAMTGGTVGRFRYTALATPVRLAANTTYYLVSEETSGGDAWYDWDTTVTATGAARDTAVVWGSGGPGTWRLLSTTNHSFVPLSFIY